MRIKENGPDGSSQGREVESAGGEHLRRSLMEQLPVKGLFVLSLIADVLHFIALKKTINSISTQLNLAVSQLSGRKLHKSIILKQGLIACCQVLFGVPVVLLILLIKTRSHFQTIIKVLWVLWQNSWE